MTPEMLYALRDQAGVPSHPVIFLILGVLTFALHPDLDVRIGGKIRVRHSASMVGATWETSVSIGEAMSGTSTVAVLPLKEGTYLFKAEDSSGILSVAAASISTNCGELVQRGLTSNHRLGSCCWGWSLWRYACNRQGHIIGVSATNVANGENNGVTRSIYC